MQTTIVDIEAAIGRTLPATRLATTDKLPPYGFHQEDKRVYYIGYCLGKYITEVLKCRNVEIAAKATHALNTLWPNGEGWER